MGITIHFEGRLKNEESYNTLVKKVIEFSSFQEWDYFQFENESVTLKRVKDEENVNYEGPTKGVHIQPHENSEPLIFEFDKDLYIQEFCKTQFASTEIHIKIIELLEILKEYFECLTVVDEGEYWETKNYDQLDEHWENFYIAMDRTIQENSSLRGPFKLKSGRIIDLM
ncbi:hypothetical protein [Chryseobacterium gleum]|uniref:hypothetical protein n=1 Tax=Chryseobacterium gleum TaxID=250 RepID=UPI0024202639|nr:hypothetical protein [Chryseobacterium gleum]